MTHYHRYRDTVTSRTIQYPEQGSPRGRGPAGLPGPSIRDERQYIQILRRLLHARIPENEIDELLCDLSDHFRMGRAAGRTEDDLIRCLGSPVEIAREICLQHQVRPALTLLVVSPGHR